MKQILMLFLCTCLYTHAQDIDKKKILSIIKGAKKGQKISKHENIIVYRKKSTYSQSSKNNIETQKSKLIQSTLPNIPPTSIILRNQMLTKNIPLKKVKNIYFKTPIQNKYSGEKTIATKITYY